MKVRVINADHNGVKEYWSQLRKYKSLIWIFAWQEIKGQYAQTFFGIFWAVLRPLIMLSIFTTLFSTLLNIHTAAPYYLFAFSGMIAWNFFFQIVTFASSSIQQKQELIRKMYFPKIILPLSKVVIASVEIIVSLIMLFVLMAFARYPVSWKLFTLPIFIFLNVCCGLCVAVWMNVLNIRYRDLNQIILPMIGMGMWFTPVFFPGTIIPDDYRFLLYFNPMAGVVAGYRYALLGDTLPDAYYLISFLVTILLVLLAFRSFIYVEDDIVDYA